MALNIENIIAEIKEASILELNDLVKAIEEEFGVTRNKGTGADTDVCSSLPILKSKSKLEEWQ